MWCAILNAFECDLDAERCRLCGYEPFYAEQDKEIYKKILKGSYSFDSPWWDEISENAKVKNPGFH